VADLLLEPHQCGTAVTVLDQDMGGHVISAPLACVPSPPGATWWPEPGQPGPGVWRPSTPDRA